MVLLGGLEFVAAGYVWNELNKDNKKDVKKHRSDSRDRRHRKEHRKHDHRHDSSDSSPSPHRPRPSRPPQQQGGLRPPQNGPPRPYSAPPPGSRPMWQPQPFQGQPQQWQTNPVAYYPPQQAPVPLPFPPPQMPNHPAPQIPRPAINVPPPHINPSYPPPGTYLDMKTGKVQHNLYPPGHEAARSQDFLDESGRRDIGFSNVVLHAMDQHHIPNPQPGYAELDSETPGRYRPYDEKRGAPPPPYQEYR